MATVTLEISDELKSLAEQRAAEAGLSNLSDYLFQLLLSDAGGGPRELTIDSDEDLEQLALSRADGPVGGGEC